MSFRLSPKKSLIRVDLDLQNLIASARAIKLSNKQVVLIKEQDQNLYHLQNYGKYCNHYNRCGKQNHFESKCKTQISQVNKIENSSDSDDSCI